ncbi:hypothetical protein B4083_1418 [Bacillus cereus]|nr:hypothetical protein B4083_1418 [Bacillus cereus]
MKAKEMLKVIKEVETLQHGIKSWTVERARTFQTENLDEQEKIEFDSTFYEFVETLNTLYGCRVAIPTAKKILNNSYIAARNNKLAIQAITPMEIKVDSDVIEFLITNGFNIDHAVFAKGVSQEAVEEIKEAMPKDSALFRRLKNAADLAYPSPRGFSYDYLNKVVAGFSSVWHEG